MFYLHYAARNLWRNRRWSVFAIFSIAAGVATIVALRSLGLAIEDSLTSNLRASNHGDYSISQGAFGFFSLSFGDEDNNDRFDEVAVDAVRTWAEVYGGTVSAYYTTAGVQIAAPNAVTAGRPQFMTSFFVDPQTYPPSHTVVAIDPPGVPLNELFNGGREVVVSQNLADSQGIAVGDQVRVSGTTDEYTVTGIVSSEYESGFRNLFAAFFGFAYFDIAQMEPLSLEPAPNALAVVVAEEYQPQSIEEADVARRELRALVNAPVATVPDLRAENQQVADLTSQFIVVMGLGALLIGGVGIVNTMLVMVRRRTEEIAALKTFGLKARQVALLFMAEALLLGFAGSLVGSLFGILLSRLANSYGETLIQQPLAWRLQPEALIFGLSLGVVVAGVFGVLPVLTAARIRPSIMLRPNQTHIPRAGVLQSIFALIFVVLALGLIAGQILNNILIGVIGTAVTLILLGILILLLWVVVWLVGRIPAFGSVDLRLALRNLRARRLRTATTLLALSAGMFALSSITFFGEGSRQIFQMTLSETLGGNVMIFPLLPPGIANPLIDNRLESLEGVTSRTRLLTFNGDVIAINGEAVDQEAVYARQRELREQMRVASESGDFIQMGMIEEEMDSLPDYDLDIVVRETTGTNLSGNENVTQGRALTLEDIGQPVILMRDEDLEELGAPLGAIITLRVGGETYDLEIIGTQPAASATPGEAIAPPGVISGGGGALDFQFTLAEVEPEHLDTVLLSLSAMPLVISLDISFIDGLIGRFINQFSALPILVGILSLGAAAVIMANTVALATLERRQQIGVLKAVGLKGRRVLWVMLLENLLISLLGGLLGVGLSALGVLMMSSFSTDVSFLVPDDAVPVAIALILAAVAIAALATFASAQAVIRERALNVLRYE